MGLRGLIGGCQGVPGGREGIQGIPWGHRVGLMSLFMIHKGIYACIQVIQIFIADGTERTNQSKVVQEVLADLKRGLLL